MLSLRHQQIFSAQEVGAGVAQVVGEVEEADEAVSSSGLE
jgi:hypothetical protein